MNSTDAIRPARLLWNIDRFVCQPVRFPPWAEVHLGFSMFGPNMNPDRFTNLTDDEMRLISAECETFEKAFADEQPARIDDHLKVVPEQIRSALFCELLAIEIEHRQSRGRSPNAAEYCERVVDFWRTADRLRDAHPFECKDRR